MIIAPVSRNDNPRYRIDVFTRAEKDIEFRKLVMCECARNFKWFCNTFLWTFDPREPLPHKPFILWPKQEMFIDWVEGLYRRSQNNEKINGYVDKPRGVGASYVLMAWCLWHYLFDNFSARIGSRKEDYVEKKGEPDALFFKIDYMLDRLPAWMKAPYSRPYMILRREDTSGNSIVGESANPNFGRGGRKSVILFDEFGFWEWARTSWESAGEATNLRIAFTTMPPAGHDSHAYKLLTGQAGKVEIFSFDWNDDPRRDEKWLAEAKATKSEEEFAREVMKSAEGTTKGKVYAVALQHAELTDADYHPELPLFISWDFGLDEVAMIWWQINFNTRKVRMIDCYSNSNKEIDFYVPFVAGTVEMKDCKITAEDYSEYELELIKRHSSWKKTITHFGDPDASKRNLINKDSVKDYLYAKRGIYIESKAWGGREWIDMREKAVMLFRRLEINDKRCEPVLSALRNAAFPEIREGSQRQNEPLKPVHNWCVTGNTKIRTLDGWKQIKNVEAGDYVWGYSENKKMLDVGRVSQSFIAGFNKELVEIGLDNGKSIKCTPDHLFMMRDGNYCQAQYLKVADSLMPFYELNDSGYIKIDLNNGSFAREHQYIFNKFNGFMESDFVIDHKDGNHFNNHPGNLQKLKMDAHCRKNFFGIKSNEERKSIDKTDYAREFYDHSLTYKICGYCGNEYRGSHKTLYCSVECSRIAWSIREVANKNYEKRSRHSCELCGDKCSRRAKRCRKCRNFKNHKVRFVKFISERATVYDLTVPELNNFVAEGVVIHNCSHYRSSVEYFADNEPMSGEVKTIVGRTGAPMAEFKPPQDIEQEKIKREKDKLANIEKIFARTTVGNVGNSNLGKTKFRPL